MIQTLFLIAQGVASVSGAIALGALHYYFHLDKKAKSESIDVAPTVSEPVETVAPGSKLFRDQSGDAARALRQALDAVVDKRREQADEAKTRPFEFCVFDE